MGLSGFQIWLPDKKLDVEVKENMHIFLDLLMWTENLNEI